MQDRITIQRIELLHPALRAEVREIYAKIVDALEGRAICRFSHTLRTFAEQAALFAQGRTTKGEIVTKARAGRSYHNYGLAIDIVLIIDTNKDGTFDTANWQTNVDFDGDGIADWQEVVTIFKEYGWEWGGDWRFSDTPHFQKTMGKSIEELLRLYNAKKLIPNSNYVNI